MILDSTIQPTQALRAALGPSLIPALTILCHPSLERVGERALLLDTDSASGVLLSRLSPLFGAPGASRGAPLGDAHLSRTPLSLHLKEGGGLRLYVGQCPTVVAADGEVIRGEREFTPEEIERGVVLELSDRVVLALHLAAPSEGSDDSDLGLVGQSPAVERVRREIRRVADLDVPVLIRGETGTGKELVARAIHTLCPRRQRAFVAVNMASIPPSLAGAELFGVERGAFTGAVSSRLGYFAAARGGTLFLDEIGDTPPDVQVMLLRALEAGEIQAIGSHRTQLSDVRILAATDADLEGRIAAGTFRAPLLHRLAGFEIALPPLRARLDDIGRLFVHFLREELRLLGEPDRWREQRQDGRLFVPAALVARLARYDWPGNIRQLRNVVRQVVVGSRGAPALEAGPALERLLTRDSQGGGAPVAMTGEPHQGDAQAADAERPRVGRPRPNSERRRPAEVTEDELVAALRVCRWDLKAAAERLRVSRTSLYALVERCSRVRKAGDLAPEEIAQAYRECRGDVESMVDRLQVSRKALSRRIRELALADMPLASARTGTR
ncbi:sigma 54-interacting transcriptional regulator [Sorangium sp. So ce341]|uniref:sigma 54-interacting transcriptional regulator n=1 Tax=Sorangium sp. So ce341 TaxID=3133302 RepID=UPI003F624FEE